MNKIDLGKNQLVEGDVKVKVWNNEKDRSYERYLFCIDHNLRLPFLTFYGGTKRSDQISEIVSWKNAELIEPKYRVKDFYSLVEVLKSEGFVHMNLHNLLVNPEDTRRFFYEMFKYCGRLVDNDFCIDNYVFNKSWLEEVQE